jgi:all-trans-8'-apo-beta-carotenal 15,15'-oxygenase
VERGTAVEIELGPDSFPSEPVLAPRPGARSEEDAYVLTLAYDGAAGASHVSVLDASAPQRGVLARAWFGRHVPFTFHGTWCPSGERA